jgi:hypothetical protein
MRRQKSKSLKRPVAIRPPKTTIRVYSEGQSTEPEYIDAFKRLPELAEAVAIDISIERTGASPMTLVEMACEARRRSELDVDHFWCVFDVESPMPHPNLDRARQMARDNGVNLAVSNPCFEVWLILHLEDQNAYMTTAEAVHRRKELDGANDKHLDSTLYMPRRHDAAARAARLKLKHAGDGSSFPQDNPSSSFADFVNLVEARAAASVAATASDVE